MRHFKDIGELLLLMLFLFVAGMLGVGIGAGLKLLCMKVWWLLAWGGVIVGLVALIVVCEWMGRH